MPRRLLLILGLACLVGCAAKRTAPHVASPPGDSVNVTVYLSNQRPGQGRVSLAVYVDGRLVTRASPTLDIHDHVILSMDLPAGPHSIRVVGAQNASATAEFVVDARPTYVSVSWWGLAGSEPLQISVQNEPFGFC